MVFAIGLFIDILYQIKVKVRHTVDWGHNKFLSPIPNYTVWFFFLVGKCPASLREGYNRHLFDLNMTTFTSGFQECI